ncbi:MAG: helix-turn-helix domain-containing protein [Gemmatimonadota bacterium]
MSKERGFTEIGKRLLSIRGSMDQRGFSRHVNVSQQAISNYERGNLPASWAFLRRMNEDFNVNLNWLITGQGQRDHRAGSPYASLADNRPPGWPRAFLGQVALSETDPLEVILQVYLLYLATEPADARARLMSDLQAVIEAARIESGTTLPAGEDCEAMPAVYDAISRDDRRLAVAALLRLGERLESSEVRDRMSQARRVYLAALGLASLQGWVEDEVEAGRRVGRTFRKEGSWEQAERFFRPAVQACEHAGSAAQGDGDGAERAIPAPTCARAWLGYGHVARESGELAQARERYLVALEWALRTSDAALRAEVYLDLACLSYRERDWSKALDFVGTGRAFAEQAGDAPMLRKFKLAEAVVLRDRGDLETAKAILTVLADQAEREKDLRAHAHATTNLANVLADRNEIAEAVELLTRTQEQAEANGSPRCLAMRMMVQARLASAQGEEGASRTLLQDCLSYARLHGLSEEFEQAAALLAGEQERGSFTQGEASSKAG